MLKKIVNEVIGTVPVSKSQHGQASCKQKTQHACSSKHPEIGTWETKKTEISGKEVKMQANSAKLMSKYTSNLPI